MFWVILCILFIFFTFFFDYIEKITSSKNVDNSKMFTLHLSTILLKKRKMNA